MTTLTKQQVYYNKHDKPWGALGWPPGKERPGRHRVGARAGNRKRVSNYIIYLNFIKSWQKLMINFHIRNNTFYIISKLNHFIERLEGSNIGDHPWLTLFAGKEGNKVSDLTETRQLLSIMIQNDKKNDNGKALESFFLSNFFYACFLVDKDDLAHIWAFLF